MKRIILSERAFKVFKQCLVNEALKSNDIPFCSNDRENKEYNQRLRELSTIPNLRVDRYKDENLENAYDNWSNVGFDKSSMEYKVWCGHLQRYLEFLERGLDFVNQKKNRIGEARPHYIFADLDWMRKIKSSNVDDYQGIYSLTLKIYQNRVIWNDLFFNPIFNNLKETYKEIRSFANKKKILDKKYSLLLPMEEYIELGKFMNNPENARPELFFDTNVEISTNHQTDDTEEFDWG